MGSNPLNVDPPQTAEDFVSNFNDGAIGYLDEIESYALIVDEVEEANTIGEELINLVTVYAIIGHHTSPIELKF